MNRVSILERKLFSVFPLVWRRRLVSLIAFSVTCAVRGGTERSRAGSKDASPTPPHDFVTFVHSRGLRGAPPHTIRGSIDWGTLFSAEHLVQSMTFALTLTTSVSTAPQLLSNHFCRFYCPKTSGKRAVWSVWNSRFQRGLLLFEETVSFWRSNLVSHPAFEAILQVLCCVYRKHHCSLNKNLLSWNIFYFPSSSQTAITAVNRSCQRFRGAW